MWEVLLLKNKVKAQTTATLNNILAHTTKLELAKYYHIALFK